jgi:hypothetical protein
MKKAASFTIEEANLLWLKAQAAASDAGTVSGVVDRLITDARTSGKARPDAVRSVAGTIDLPDDDPELRQADEYVRALFERSAARPLVPKERRAGYKVKARRRG